MSAAPCLKRLRLTMLISGVVLCTAVGELAALEAAGLKGIAPTGGDVITQLVGTLQSNWEWLIGTGVGLVLVIIAGLMIFGSQRAPDHLARVIGGVLLILVVIPAVLK